jgi:opacity protein-like surface antigen
VKHRRAKLATTAILSGLLVSTNVQDANPLGLYVGAGGGHADLRVDSQDYFLSGCTQVPTSCFTGTASGWTAFVDLQPLPFVGAELQYIDFGHTTKENPYGGQNSTRARALALFGRATVALPFVDLYAKAGVGQLRTKTSVWNADPNACLDTNGAYCGFSSLSDKTAARFGWGLGVQFKLSSLALRGEYVRFSSADGDPDLLSVALLWKF